MLIPHLNHTIQLILEQLGDSPTLYNNSNNTNGNINNNNNIGVHPNIIIPLLNKLHNYLGCLYLLKHINIYLQSESEKDTSIKKEYKIDKNNANSNIELIGWLKQLEIIITLVHDNNNYSLDFKINKVIQDNNNISDDNTITQHESEAISNYFKNKVATAPYHKENIICYFHLLTVPITLLKEFIKLMSHNNNAHNNIQMELILYGIYAVGNSVPFTHNKTTCKITFMVLNFSFFWTHIC